MKTITGLLIDPSAKVITEVEYHGDYHEINAHIGADCFDLCYFNNAGDAVFVDDCGLMGDPDSTDYFVIFGENGEPNLLAGKGLVFGTDAEGDTVSPSIRLGLLKRLVLWPEKADAVRVAQHLLAESGKVITFDSGDDMAAFLEKGR